MMTSVGKDYYMASSSQVKQFEDGLKLLAAFPTDKVKFTPVYMWAGLCKLSDQ